jgi:hypothetical protein
MCSMRGDFPLDTFRHPKVPTSRAALSSDFIKPRRVLSDPEFTCSTLYEQGQDEFAITKAISYLLLITSILS